MAAYQFWYSGCFVFSFHPLNAYNQTKHITNSHEGTHWQDCHIPMVVKDWLRSGETPQGGNARQDKQFVFLNLLLCTILWLDYLLMDMNSEFWFKAIPTSLQHLHTSPFRALATNISRRGSYLGILHFEVRNVGYNYYPFENTFAVSWVRLRYLHWTFNSLLPRIRERITVSRLLFCISGFDF